MVAALGLVSLSGYGAAMGGAGSDQLAGSVADRPRPAAVVEAWSGSQAETASRLGVEASKQILFGDFRTHTTFSFDAFLMSMPMAGGAGGVLLARMIALVVVEEGRLASGPQLEGVVVLTVMLSALWHGTTAFPFAWLYGRYAEEYAPESLSTEEMDLPVRVRHT